MKLSRGLCAALAAALLLSACGDGGSPEATPTSPECPSPTPTTAGVSPSPIPPECLLDADRAEEWGGEWAEGSGFKISEFCRQFVPIRGTISFTVAGDGTLSGHYEWANDPYTCGGPAPSVPSEGEVTGERTANGFLLEIFGEGYPLLLTRRGNEASGRVEAGGNTTHALIVRCLTC